MMKAVRRTPTVTPIVTFVVCSGESRFLRRLDVVGKGEKEGEEEKKNREIASPNVARILA